LANPRAASVWNRTAGLVQGIQQIATLGNIPPPITKGDFWHELSLLPRTVSANVEVMKAGAMHRYDSIDAHASCRSHFNVSEPQAFPEGFAAAASPPMFVTACADLASSSVSLVYAARLLNKGHYQRWALVSR
jgi:hypothetical protein